MRECQYLIGILRETAENAERPGVLAQHNTGATAVVNREVIQADEAQRADRLSEAQHLLGLFERICLNDLGLDDDQQAQAAGLIVDLESLLGI